VLAVVLTVVLAVAAGAALERRSNAAAHRARTLALSLALWVLVPFIAYVNIARTHLSVDAGLAIAVAALAIAAAGVAMWRLGPGVLGLDRRTTGAAIVCTIQANTAYLGLPLCAALFTHAEFTQAVAYDALITLPTFVLGSYSVGALFGAAGEAGRAARLRAGIVRNPVLAAVAAGLLVPDAWAPESLVTPSRVAVFLLLPIGFFVVGVTLADEAKDGTLRVPPALTPPVAAVAALRLLFVPAVLLLVGALLIDVPAPFYLLAAMPVGVNTVIVAHATGLDLPLSAASIAWTTAIALVGVIALRLAGVVG
jgi:predicted permease